MVNLLVVVLGKRQPFFTNAAFSRQAHHLPLQASMNVTRVMWLTGPTLSWSLNKNVGEGCWLQLHVHRTFRTWGT